MKKAVIVLPTYNEAPTIKLLIEQIRKVTADIVGWSFDVLVVDSSSPDKTAATVRSAQKKNANVHILVTPKEGLGRAYITGFQYAVAKLGADVVFEMDADFSHSPKALPKFIKKIEGGADFVIGSRYIRGGSIPKKWDLHRKIFSVLGNLIIRVGFMKPGISDWTSGYRAIKVPVILKSQNYIQKYSGYVFQVALLDYALKKQARIAEVPIQFIDRKYGVSKINASQYIAQTLWYVFTNSTFIRYFIVGISGAVIDFGVSFLIIEVGKITTNLYWLATLISAELAIISNFLLNNFWSFSHKKLEAKPSVYFKQFLKFNLIASGGLLIQAGGIQLFSNIFGPQWWYLYKALILAFVIIPYSYILYNKVIWKNR